MTELETPKDGQRIFAVARVIDECGLPIKIHGSGIYHADSDTVENEYNGEHLPFHYITYWEESEAQE